MTIHDFDDIRPFLPEELPAVYDRLLQDPEFLAALAYVFPGIPQDALAARMRSCPTNLDFQLTMVYPMLQQLLSKAATSLTANFQPIDCERQLNHTFVSNHRDIVLDSALLSYVLHDNGYNTVEIAIGDNLLIRPWIKDLVRVNKSFIVQRALTMRQMLLASAHMSKYMHFCINEKHENIWIAQREGRAKDSNDRTQDSVLKMMAMGGDLRQLNIVPLALSYEYDPCDYLKAQEMQNKRDVEGFKKSQQDDLDNMRTGIFGWKGKIHYHSAPCINEWLDTLPSDMPKADYFRAVAEHIDQEIHRHYHLYAGNYVAADLLLAAGQGPVAQCPACGDSAAAPHTSHYTPEEKAHFEAYVEQRLALVTLPHPDVDFLRRCILTMYANPVFNHEAAL